MPAKEIKELRQSGKLKEALAMAQEELDAQPDNIWGKRNMSWVYYEYLKKYAMAETFDDFLIHLNNLKALNLPKGENMLFDNVAWQVGKLLFSLQNKLKANTNGFESAKINFELLEKGKLVLEAISNFYFTKPSDQYTFIFKGFHKLFKESSFYIDFCDWWGFENFQDNDYNNETYNHREIMSIVEQAYISYSKALLNGTLQIDGQLSKTLDKVKIKDFLVKLDHLIDSHPEYQYPPYFKAKLLLAVGDEDDILSAFLPFAKQKQKESWVWDLMAEIFHDDKNLVLSCYCKSLSLKTPSEFLIKTRFSFVKILIEQKLFSEAKVEINNIIDVRKSKKWKIPNEIITWTQSDWYINARSSTSNIEFYYKHKGKAEELLYKDLPKYIVAVEFVNRNKKILNFVKNEMFHGFFKYQGIVKNPKIGDVLKVRLEPIGNEGFYKALTVEKIKSDDLVDIPAIKDTSGVINIPEDKPFGFIDDVFVPPNIIEENNLSNKEKVKIKAVLSFNKSKEKWGWKVISVYN